MVLYHGTSFIRGETIIKEGAIRKDAPKVYDDSYMIPKECIASVNSGFVPTDLRTTGGFVYLTPDIFLAIYHGNFTAMKDDDKRFCVFRVEIDEMLLSPDLDEAKMVYRDADPDISLEKSLMEYRSAAYPGNITDFSYYVYSSANDFYARDSLSVDVKDVLRNYWNKDSKKLEKLPEDIRQVVEELRERISSVEWKKGELGNDSAL